MPTCKSLSIDSKEMTMTIATVGIDLAKNVFAVHAVGKERPG